MSAKVILHVDLDAFFAAVEQRDRPELRGRPVVIGADPRAGRGRGVVSTCSYEARRYGIHSAMPISTAYRRCPEAVFLPPDMKKYRQVADQILNCFYGLTPDVEPVSIDEAFLDISGTDRLWGTPRQAGQLVKQRVRDAVGLTASVGIAPNKMVAKIASDYGKPDGLLEVSAEGVLAFLWPLAVDRLWGVGPRTGQILAQLGIRTVGELAHYPVDLLVRRLGDSGRRLADLAQGRDPREVVAADAVKSVSHEHTFAVDTVDRNQIGATLLSLSEQVSRRLRQAGLRGRTVSVKVRNGKFVTATRAVTLPERTNFADVIYAQAKLLCQEFVDAGEPVRLLGVRVTGLSEGDVQDDLFVGTVDVRRERIHQAIDDIQDRFGAAAIHRVR